MKRYLKRAGALALSLLLLMAILPAGLALPAEAAVSVSDAQAYLDILNQTKPDDSYLIDFDGDGRDELLTVTVDTEDFFDAHYSVYQGSRALVTDQQMPVAGGVGCSVAAKDGKTYIVHGISGYDYDAHFYYSVRNGQWVKEVELEERWSDDSDWLEETPGNYFVDGREVSEAEYNRIDTFQHQFSILDGGSSGSVSPQLEGIVLAEALKSAGPDEILAQIPYYGDQSRCRMTPEQAAAFAQTLERLVEDGSRLEREYEYDFRDTGSVSGAALCDIEGNGTPALLVYYDLIDLPEWAYEHDVRIYLWNDGQLTQAEDIRLESDYATVPSMVFSNFGKNEFGGYAWSSYSHSLFGEEYIDTRYCKNGRVQEVFCQINAIIDDDDGYIKSYDVFLDDVFKKSFPGDTDISEVYDWASKLVGEAGGPVESVPEKSLSLSSMISLLRAYEDAKKFPTYNYEQMESGDKYYSGVAKAVEGKGTIQAIYKLLEDACYALLENSGAYSGALVRGVREKGRIVWKTDREDDVPLSAGELDRLAAEIISKPNMTPDYGKISGFSSDRDLLDYLQDCLDNMDGVTPNDAAKTELAAFIENSIAGVCSGSVSGADNRLTADASTLGGLLSQAQSAKRNVESLLQSNDVELNKGIVGIIRILWQNCDWSQPCQLSLDPSLAEALKGCDVQFLLADGRHYVRLSDDCVRTLTDRYGSLSVQLSRDGGAYTITFLDSEGKVIEQLDAPVTVGLPADSMTSTVMVSHSGGSDNWGGQFDPSAGVVSFGTRRSGQYEVLENDARIDDIGELSEESQAAIRFMVSKGFLTLEDGSFDPSGVLTRYQFTQALVGMFFALDPSLTTSFEDVPADSEYYSYVASAEARGIVVGYDEVTFGGDNSMTVEQMLALAARTLVDQKGYALPTDAEQYLNSFEDRETISGWARQEVAMAVREKLVDRGGVLDPLAGITREQAAVILYRLFLLLYEVPPVALELPPVTETAARTETSDTESEAPSAAVITAAVGGVTLAGGGVGAAWYFLVRKKGHALFKK